MHTIKPKHGGRRPGAGRKKTPSTQLKDAIQEINIPKIVKKLERWSQGKEVVCPHCQERTGVYVPDTVALQSALELLNRRLGKVPQQVQVDITETIQLNADQLEGVLRNNLPQIVEMYRTEIMGLLGPVSE
jgi:hypothetical protein